MYCSDECANHDASHKESCPAKVAFDYEIIQKFIMANLQIVNGFDSMSELLVDDMKKTVFDFDLSNPDDPMYEKNLLIAVNSLSTVVEVEFEGLSSTETHIKLEEQEFKTKSALKYLRIWCTNAFEMLILFESSTEKAGMYGSGVFPFMSLLNHSCYPNVDTVAVDNKFVLTVTRPIKAGEQIFITYGYSSVLYTRKEREKLLARYKFTCDCIACIEDYPKLEKLPKVKLCGFKQPPKGESTGEAAIQKFKINCNLIEKNIKKHPTYEIMQLIDVNRVLLHGLVRL